MNDRSSKDSRQTELSSPTGADAPLTRRRFLAGTGVILAGPALLGSCGTTRADRGEVRTYVHTGDRFDVDAWFRNFKAGHTFVSNGPALEFTVDGELPGPELARAPGTPVRIHAHALGQARIGLPTVLRVKGPSGVVCDNHAVAHTSPVYVVVNAKPTWDAGQGPGLIKKQLAAMAKIESEFATGDDARSLGIRERLQKARAFHLSLRERMRAG